MKSIAVQSARELLPQARQWLQSILGRELREEEEVAVVALPSAGAPAEALRQAAVVRLHEVMDQAAGKAAPIPDGVLDELIKDALTHVRRREP